MAALGDSTVKNTEKLANIDDQTKCWICNNVIRRTCDKCMVSFSSCVSSESADWFIHKTTPCNCDTASKKPVKHVFAILLPEDSEKPVLVQVPVNRITYCGSTFDNVDFKSLLGNYDFRRNVVGRNPYKKDRALKNVLEVFHKDNFFNDGSKPNKLIKKITKNKSTHDWRGPLIVVKFKGLVLSADPVYIDASFDDLVDVVDFFRWYGNQ
jgi:hypothetical protein